MQAQRTKKESYLIEGMSCDDCERTIKQAMETIAGVHSADADLKSSTVSIVYEPEKVTIGEIKSSIGTLGYRLRDERPVFGQREGSDEAIA
ncbi:MAG TPA: heavy-metal-associated domain-containing protein [Ohtaekwangia sp.]|nr:heavy-metal-associated domain-containing protein [Ohtaekwangia sp.]